MLAARHLPAVAARGVGVSTARLIERRKRRELHEATPRCAVPSDSQDAVVSPNEAHTAPFPRSRGFDPVSPARETVTPT